MNLNRWAIFIFLWTLATGNIFGQSYEYPFQNPDLPVEERIDNLLSLMTLDEKVAALSTNPGVPRLGVKGSGHIEGLHGVAQGGPAQWGSRDRPPVPTTTFPQAYGLGETWDPELIQRAAAVEGYEARYLFQKYDRGGIVVRAPNADLGRDPRWGRTEECYGEDPFFNGKMTVAFVKGLQGDHPVYWQAASLMKHFLANSHEVGRTYTSSDFDERLWREYYSVPFRMGVIEGGSRAYMAAYNGYNGVPGAVHPMLKEITVKEWGQNGIICTDGGAYRQLVTDHKRFPDLNLAAQACIEAGINQFLDRYQEGVYGALANNYLTEQDIDEALRGVYRVMIRLGLLDPPERVPFAKIGMGSDTLDPWLTEEHQELAREVTRKSIVLLKNDQNLLPLDKDQVASIAVIGPRADDVLLDWYSGTPPYTVTALEGIKSKVGDKVNLLYAKSNYLDSAVNFARKADVAIVAVGNHPTCDAGWEECPVRSEGKEAVDRRSLELEQEDLIKKVYAANPNTIVVLISSFPYAINWTQENVPAILHMANNSQELGNALADVIFGDYNPGGRLTQTWVKSITDLPDMLDYNIRNGRTYQYFTGVPLYPFGYGLSYTSFAYSELQVAGNRLDREGNATVRFRLQNTGDRAGDEAPQLYVQYPDSRVARPMKELKGFQRIFLNPGESTTVEIPLAAEDLAYWDPHRDQWTIEPGRIRILIGSSSSDIRMEKVIRVE